MDIRQTGGAAPKRSASPAIAQLSTMLQPPVSISRRFSAPSPSPTAEPTVVEVNFNHLPTETQQNIIGRLDTKTLAAVAPVNPAFEKITKERLIEKSVEDFVETHHLTRPEGNPTDPAFLRAAINEYVTRPGAGELSESMRTDLKTSLSIYAEEVQEAGAVQPLFSMHEIITQPQKAAEFTALSGFFNDRRKRVREFQAMASGSDKILTHMQENPAAWLRLTPFRVDNTIEAVNTGGEAAAFVKNNIDSWLQLTSVKMQDTIDVLNNGGDAAAFVKNHTEAWLKLDERQMRHTKEALNAGGAVAELLQNNTERWLKLDDRQMYYTTYALNDDGAAAEFVQNHTEAWLGLSDMQMHHTIYGLNAGGAVAELLQNNTERWLKLDDRQMYRTKEALNDGGAVAELLQNNTERWLKLDDKQMQLTIEALSAGSAVAEFVKNQPEAWCELSAGQMNQKYCNYAYLASMRNI